MPRPHWTLFGGDILVLQGDPTAPQPMVDQAKLKMLGAEEIAALKPRNKDDVLETVEAIVSPDSPLIGRTPQELHQRQSYEINLIALSRGGEQTTARLRHNRFQPGDIVVLQGRQTQLNNALTELHLLALAERNLVTLRGNTPAASVVIGPRKARGTLSPWTPCQRRSLWNPSYLGLGGGLPCCW